MKKRKWIIICSCFILILLLGVGGYVYSIYYHVEKTVALMHMPIERKKSEKRPIQVDVTESAPISILLMGVDEREGDRGRSDTLIVITVNPKEKSMNIVSIPRDTRTEIIGKGIEDKINHAYAFGGVEMAINTVEHFLNIPIDYYIKINMEGFEKIIDTLGGVTIDNPFSFEYAGEVFSKGTLHLTGEQALKYARMRYDDPRGDFGRQDRQKLIIKAVIEEGASFSSLTNYRNLLNSIGAAIKTNLTFDEMKEIQENYRDASKEIKPLYITGEGKKLDGIYYLIVPESERQHISTVLRNHLNLKKVPN